MDEKYHKFSDFSEEEVGLEGDKKKIEEILNTKILLIGFRIGKSKYKEKEYMTLQFENGGNKYIVFSGSEVLMKQAHKYAAEIPFYTAIKKVNEYYTMT